MKRSSTATLALIGLALAGCADPVETAVYTDLQSCIAAEGDTNKCTENLALAKEYHEKHAPAFKTQADCEAEFGPGQCGQATEKHDAVKDAAQNPTQTAQASGGGSSPFIPFFAGYMIGNMLSSNNGVAAQPVYRTSRSNNFMSAAGATVASKPGRTSVYASSFSSSPKSTSVMSRGGFGARASSFGG